MGNDDAGIAEAVKVGIRNPLYSLARVPFALGDDGAALLARMAKGDFGVGPPAVLLGVEEGLDLGHLAVSIADLRANDERGRVIRRHDFGVCCALGRVEKAAAQSYCDCLGVHYAALHLGRLEVL